jgi:hypothetical protein
MEVERVAWVVGTSFAMKERQDVIAGRVFAHMFVVVR